MIRIQQLKVRVDAVDCKEPVTGAICETERKQIEKSLRQELRIASLDGVHYNVIRKAIDARKKTDVFYTYTVDVEVANEKKVFTHSRSKKASLHVASKPYKMPTRIVDISRRPLIVGAGPAGLFCALLLAKAGMRPIVWERGEAMEQRCKDVDAFWEKGEWKSYSNVQFGEGGAGTFSDGKLNTLVKDVTGRNRYVLETFVEHGAPEDILYLAKPHIGSDQLRLVIPSIRREIEALGGTFQFRTQLTELCFQSNYRLCSCKGVSEDSRSVEASTDYLVLATGHSARDTFSKLYQQGLQMEAKAFAVGVRVQHPQQQINEAQYKEMAKHLPPADYKLTAQVGERGVYTFCMCPGGFVVNASSEEQMLAINGMSNYNRAQSSANSAVVVTVNPDDFEKECSETVKALQGMEFQRKWERLAYQEGQGAIPVQRFADFVNQVVSTDWNTNLPETKGSYRKGNLCHCLPVYVKEAIVEGMHQFGRRISGFDSPDTCMMGVETRTSSPVRILRDDTLQSNIKGVYPCGEGAGYAGGIMSAAMDGLKVAEAIIEQEHNILKQEE